MTLSARQRRHVARKMARVERGQKPEAAPRPPAQADIMALAQTLPSTAEGGGTSTKKSFQDRYKDFYSAK